MQAELQGMLEIYCKVGDGAGKALRFRTVEQENNCSTRSKLVMGIIVMLSKGTTDLSLFIED